VRKTIINSVKRNKVRAIIIVNEVKLFRTEHKYNDSEGYCGVENRKGIWYVNNRPAGNTTSYNHEALTIPFGSVLYTDKDSGVQYSLVSRIPLGPCINQVAYEL
jgi:hypothetical protein